MRGWNDDPFTKKARREDFAARSVYKLEEIQKRERVLNGAKLIVDLGAAPGSWTQYCLRTMPGAQIIAIDLAEITVADPRLTALRGSIEDTLLGEALGDRKADVVLSDMAPNTSGMVDRDVALSFELAMMAALACDQHLKPHGNFVAKLFMSGSMTDYEKELKARFKTVRLLRPESVRKQSREIFFIGKDFRGAPAAT